VLGATLSLFCASCAKAAAAVLQRSASQAPTSPQHAVRIPRTPSNALGSSLS
jgi:hypothetical protein